MYTFYSKKNFVKNTYKNKQGETLKRDTLKTMPKYIPKYTFTTLYEKFKNLFNPLSGSFCKYAEIIY